MFRFNKASGGESASGGRRDNLRRVLVWFKPDSSADAELPEKPKALSASSRWYARNVPVVGTQPGRINPKCICIKNCAAPIIRPRCAAANIPRFHRRVFQRRAMTSAGKLERQVRLGHRPGIISVYTCMPNMLKRIRSMAANRLENLPRIHTDAIQKIRPGQQPPHRNRGDPVHRCPSSGSCNDAGRSIGNRGAVDAKHNSLALQKIEYRVQKRLFIDRAKCSAFTGGRNLIFLRLFKSRRINLQASIATYLPLAHHSQYQFAPRCSTCEDH